MFNVGGDDAGAFFPVHVRFVGQGSMAGVNIGSVETFAGEDVPFSVDSMLTVEKYSVV